MTAEHDVLAAAAHLVRAARERGVTLAVAESLTGGAVAAALVAQPGASEVLRAGVVAYANEMKVALLGVAADLLAERGSVDPLVAREMAHGVRRATGADVALATTGVAGPEPHDGKPVGTVFIAVSGLRGERARELVLDGSREDIRRDATLAVLALAAEHLAG